jgi:hypothetical protein
MGCAAADSNNLIAFKSKSSKSQVFSTEAYASEVRFFKTLELDEARD